MKSKFYHEAMYYWSKDDYYRAWSLSKDDDFELHLQMEPSFCFVNNCFDIGLKAWQTNTDIQQHSQK